jgi:hypothetical protein
MFQSIMSRANVETAGGTLAGMRSKYGEQASQGP